MIPPSGQIPPSSTRIRRRKPKDPRVPVIGWVVLAACLLVLSAIAFIGSSRRLNSRDEGPSVSNTRDLVISASSRDPGCGCIRGVLKNSSGKVFNEVQIYFRMNDKNGADLGTILAVTGMVRPHGNVEFATDRMPPNAASYSLQEIK